jgi:hypothetical protein
VRTVSSLERRTLARRKAVRNGHLTITPQSEQTTPASKRQDFFRGRVGGTHQHRRGSHRRGLFVGSASDTTTNSPCRSRWQGPCASVHGPVGSWIRRASNNFRLPLSGEKFDLKLIWKAELPREYQHSYNYRAYTSVSGKWSFSPCGNFILSWSTNGTFISATSGEWSTIPTRFQLWSAASGELVRTFEGHFLTGRPS